MAFRQVGVDPAGHGKLRYVTWGSPVLRHMAAVRTRAEGGVERGKPPCHSTGTVSDDPAMSDDPGVSGLQRTR